MDHIDLSGPGCGRQGLKLLTQTMVVRTVLCDTGCYPIEPNKKDFACSEKDIYTGRFEPQSKFSISFRGIKLEVSPRKNA
jgi:hypothetical protein